MAKAALHRFDVIAGTDGGHSVGVAQIVEPCKRQSDGFHDPLVVVADRVWRQVSAQLIREHKAAASPEGPARSRQSDCFR